MRNRWASCAVATFLLVAAACGSDTDNGEAAPVSTTVDQTTTTPAAVVPPTVAPPPTTAPPLTGWAGLTPAQQELADDICEGLAETNGIAFPIALIDPVIEGDDAIAAFQQAWAGPLQALRDGGELDVAAMATSAQRACDELGWLAATGGTAFVWDSIDACTLVATEDAAALLAEEIEFTDTSPDDALRCNFVAGTAGAMFVTVGQPDECEEPDQVLAILLAGEPVEIDEGRWWAFGEPEPAADLQSHRAALLACTPDGSITISAILDATDTEEATVQQILTELMDEALATAGT